MNLARLFVLAGFASMMWGCASGPEYNSADAEGPTADLSGSWVSPSHRDLEFSQQGEQATAKWCGMAYTGTVKGRVGMVKGPYGNWLTFTMSPDRKSGLVISTGIRDAVFRQKVGPASEDPRWADDPALSSALLCHMRVGPDGNINTTQNPTVRLVAAFLEHETFGPHCNTYVLFVPLDLPSVPSRTNMVEEKGRIAITWPHLPKVSRDELREARKKSALYAKKPCEVEGKPGWWVLTPTWEEEIADLSPTILLAELYREDPDTGAKPVDVFEVARRRPGRGWTPVTSYPNLVFTPNRKLARVRGIIEGGKPAGVEYTPVDRLELEDLLVTRERTQHGGSARNNLLLQYKNRSLPDFLREAKTEDLAAAAAAVAQASSDLDREATAVNNRAQKMMESETQKFMATTVRQMAQVYRERIELLKPIAAALQSEIDNRNR